MNEAYNEVIGASDRDRNALFAEAAARLGTAVQNVEKDFWVCWTLDALFNGMDAGSPRLLFKGGTSLSKAFGLIPRFSEDIDITVFREDIGQAVETAALDALSGKQRRVRLDAIRETCKAYINGPLVARLAQHAAAIGGDRMGLEQDPDDADGQTLLLWYPAAAPADDYIRSAVKFEAGAKSALDPHTVASVVPYIADDLDLTCACPRSSRSKPNGPSGTRSSSCLACGDPPLNHSARDLHAHASAADARGAARRLRCHDGHDLRRRAPA